MIILPRYMVEKVNGKWEVYDTKEAEILHRFDTYEEAIDAKKQLNNTPHATKIKTSVVFSTAE